MCFHHSLFAYFLRGYTIYPTQLMRFMHIFRIYAYFDVFYPTSQNAHRNRWMEMPKSV